MKLFSGIFLTFLFCLAQGHTQDLEDIIKRGTIKVALVSEDEFPFFFIGPDGQLMGSDVDLAKEIGKKLGVEVVFDRNFPTFDSVVQGISEEKADIAISDISITLNRTKIIYYSSPYLTLHMGLGINRKMISNREAEELGTVNYINKGKYNIAAQENSSYMALAKEIFPECEIIPMPSDEAGLQAVEEKKVIAYVTHELDLDKFIVSHPEKSIALKTILFSDLLDPIAIVVPPHRPRLLYFLNTYLALNPPNFTPEKLFLKYQPFIKINAISN